MSIVALSRHLLTEAMRMQFGSSGLWHPSFSSNSIIFSLNFALTKIFYDWILPRANLSNRSMSCSFGSAAMLLGFMIFNQIFFRSSNSIV